MWRRKQDRYCFDAGVKKSDLTSNPSNFVRYCRVVYTKILSLLINIDFAIVQRSESVPFNKILKLYYIRILIRQLMGCNLDSCCVSPFVEKDNNEVSPVRFCRAEHASNYAMKNIIYEIRRVRQITNVFQSHFASIQLRSN
jgi:hypothetical protein